MHKYVARRLLMFGPTLVGASLLIFVLMRTRTARPSLVVIGREGAPAAGPSNRGRP